MAALDGIKVLDFTQLLPGELCSTVLCDLGADVLRIEPLTPTMGQQLPPLVDGESLYFWSLHRNKRRIALDLKQTKGVEIIKKLAEKYDVIVENYRPGVMTRLGVGFEQLSAVNNQLIFCSVSGYGQDGSWRERPGHDLNFIAESGILAQMIQGAEKPPLPSVLISDYMAGLYASVAIVGALFERQKTGCPKHLDISMFESALSTMSIMGTTLMYERLHPDLKRFSYPRDLPSYRLYKCSDGRFLAVASLEPKFWQEFCQTIGLPDLADRVVSNKDTAAIDQISTAIESRTLDEWRVLFETTHCCVSPVNTVAEALNAPPAREHNVITHMIHPKLGDVPQITSPIFPDYMTSVGHDDRASMTVTELKRLEYSDGEITYLQSQNVILSN